MPQEKRQETSFGPIFGIIIILVLVLIGAFYFWGHLLNERDNQNPPPYIPGDSATS
jgi:type VI protein secretion system component VasF